jgi:MFS family permease
VVEGKGYSRKEKASRRSGLPSQSGRLTGACLVTVLFMGSTLVTPLYELYRRQYDFSAFVLVLLYAIYVIGNLIALLFFGRLSDQIGRKPMIYASIALAGVSALLFLTAHSLIWLFVARTASGLAVGIGTAAASAWITEFSPAEQRSISATFLTGFNYVGLALGPVLVGPLVEYAPAPLHLPFLCYLVVLAIVWIVVMLSPETVSDRASISLAPRLGIPTGARAALLVPAATGFCALAVTGFYAALGPTTVEQDLHVANRVLSNGIVAEMFIVAAGVIFATYRLSARLAMTIGLSATPFGLALLIAGQRMTSMPILLLGTTICGITAGLGYRGGLTVANSLAPADQRAEIASLYFIACFCGNALPVIGVGALGRITGARTADLAFACVITAISVLALVGALFVYCRGEDGSGLRRV